MKKLILILLFIFSLFILSSCSDNTKEVRGSVVGHIEFEEVDFLQSVSGVKVGNYYIIEISPDEYYLAFTAMSTDILSEESKGLFILGKEMFSGSGDGYIDKKLTEIKVTAYKLIEFKND